MATSQFCFTDPERGAWLEDAVRTVRDAATSYAVAHRPIRILDAIAAVAPRLGLSYWSAYELYYRKALRIRRSRYEALKLAAITALEDEGADLRARIAAARERQLQHELELDRVRQWSGYGLGSSAHGVGDDA